MASTIGTLLVGWFTNSALSIVQSVLENYKALTPEQLKALKDQFKAIPEDDKK